MEIKSKYKVSDLVYIGRLVGVVGPLEIVGPLKIDDIIIIAHIGPGAFKQIKIKYLVNKSVIQEWIEESNLHPSLDAALISCKNEMSMAVYGK